MYSKHALSRQKRKILKSLFFFWSIRRVPHSFKQQFIFESLQHYIPHHSIKLVHKVHQSYCGRLSVLQPFWLKTPTHQNPMLTIKERHRKAGALMLIVATEATTKWKPLLPLCDKTHIYVYFSHMIFLFDQLWCNTKFYLCVRILDKFSSHFCISCEVKQK